MHHLLRIALFSLIVYLSTDTALAACRTSTAIPPTSIIGLHILHPETPEAWHRIKELGVPWLRVEIHWKLTEPEEGNFEWRLADAALSQAQASGKSIMLLVNSIPDWAQKRPLSADPYRRFLEKLYERYPDQMKGVRAIEISNEPNNPGYGWIDKRFPMPESAELFAAYLREANHVVRSHAPDTLIVSGGMMRDGYDVLAYTAHVFSHDVADCIDVFAYHPYGHDGRLQEAQAGWVKYLQHLGVQGKPIWFTEYGTTDNQNRAQLLQQTFAELPELNAMFWFIDKDFGLVGDTYGLVTIFGRPKKDYELFRQLVAAHARQ